MRKYVLVLSVFLLFSTLAFAQEQVLNSIAGYNPTGIEPGNTEAPYYSDQGVRSVWYDNDLDQDGKPEVLTTDYSNGGRVHVFEMNEDNTLELVWSSPIQGEGSNVNPRWVQTGDIDGDGNREIIFPIGPAADGFVQVWEYDGSDNSYGTVPALELSSAQFAVDGVGNFRMNRERGTVYDFDGDGKDELITANYDNVGYVLGVSDEFPGFGSWQIEGGDPANTYANGSIWHAIPADYDGDGTEEIVVHHYDSYGIWSIEPTGADTYTYPDMNQAGYYNTYMAQDGVAYMGIAAVDVDNDGNDEIAGVVYGGDNIYEVALLDLQTTDDGVQVWDNDPVQVGIITEDLYSLAGNTAGSIWGMDTYDFDEDGFGEIYLGGAAGYNIIKLTYNGSGDVLDKGSYTPEIVFEGAEKQFFNVDYYDSLGVIDTVRGESPFVSKVFAGGDLNGNGKKEILASYQSVADSITYRFFTYNADSGSYFRDSTVMIASDQAVNMRVLEWDATNGFVDAGQLEVVTPDDYVLNQNYPNPFNPSTQISFTLPLNNKISLKVFDILGNEVKTLIDGQELAKGQHSVQWNGTNNSGTKVASGTYIYTLKFGNFQKSSKMVLLK